MFNPVIVKEIVAEFAAAFPSKFERPEAADCGPVKFPSETVVQVPFAI